MTANIKHQSPPCEPGLIANIYTVYFSYIPGRVQWKQLKKRLYPIKNTVICIRIYLCTIGGNRHTVTFLSQIILFDKRKDNSLGGTLDREAKTRCPHEFFIQIICQGNHIRIGKIDTYHRIFIHLKHTGLRLIVIR